MEQTWYLHNNIQKVVIKHLSFQDCGEQVQYSDSVSDSSTLYFQDCKTIVIQYSVITITGPYFLQEWPQHNHTWECTHWLCWHRTLYIVFTAPGYTLKFLYTAMTKDIDLANVNVELKNTDVFHEYVHASYDPTMKFTGINITLMRDGEDGEIILSNVDVSRTTRGNGISIALLDRVRDSNMYYLCASL